LRSSQDSNSKPRNRRREVARAFLDYASEFEVEADRDDIGDFEKRPREDLLRRDIDAYEQVLPNLRKHAPGYPSADL
jgi:hypothetical protein